MPYKLGFNYNERIALLNSFSDKPTRLIHFVFGGKRCCLHYRIKTKLEPSASIKHYLRILRNNSRLPVVFPKHFCDLNFQLKNPSRSSCVSFHK